MKKILSSLAILSILTIPSLALAHVEEQGGHTGPVTVVMGAVHDHDEGTTHAQSLGGFQHARPWGGEWWMSVCASLVLIGLLSMRIQRYLVVT